MNGAALYHDVEARLQADTGAHGLYATGNVLVTGVFNNYVNPSQRMPFIVWDLVSVVQTDCFDNDLVDCTFNISVYADKTPPALSRAQYILNRIYGDAIYQSNRTPTFGLHRHILTYTYSGSVTNSLDIWRYTPCVRVNAAQAHEEDYYHFIETYQCMAYRTYDSTHAAYPY